jgi:hypothetical protein
MSCHSFPFLQTKYLIVRNAGPCGLAGHHLRHGEDGLRDALAHRLPDLGKACPLTHQGPGAGQVPGHAERCDTQQCPAASVQRQCPAPGLVMHDQDLVISLRGSAEDLQPPVELVAPDVGKL